jgi:hypothetical protein
MQMQRAAPPHPMTMTSNGPQRNGNAATLPHHGRIGVNSMSSHQNYYRPPQYHHYHHPMNASHGRHDLSSQQASSFRPSHSQVRIQAPQFNKIMNIPELIQAAYSSLSAMSPSDTAAFWNSLARQMGRNNELNLTYEQMCSHINQLFEHTRRTLGSFCSKDLSQTTLSMAKLFGLLRKSRDSTSHSRKDNIGSSLSNLLLNGNATIKEDVFLSLANVFVRKMNQFNAQSLSNLAYAYALIRFVPVLADGSDLFDHIAIQVNGRTKEFKPQEVSNMVWAFTTVKKRHDALFKAMGDQVVTHEHLNGFEPQHFSNIVWAYATAGVNHPQLFEKVANHIVRHDHLRDFKPQHLSNTVWAYATAQVYHRTMFEKMANHIVGLDHLREFKPQAIANIMWAYATAGVNHRHLFEKVANHIVQHDHLRDFDPQAISNIVWAYATAQVSHPKMFQHVAKAAIQRKEELVSQHVANLLWSYAAMGIFHKQLFSSFAPTAAKLIDDYNNQELAKIAWAFAVANIDAPTLFHDRFIDRCLDNLGFSIENLSQLHQWHLWQTKEKSRTGLPDVLRDGCYTTFTSKAPRPSKFQDDVIVQLSSIGLNPKEEVLMDSGYRIDALVKVNGKTIGVEVDGPSHFIGRSKSPLARTILKRRQVPSIDAIKLVSVSYWEWDNLGMDEAKKQDYLRELLEL